MASIAKKNLIALFLILILGAFFRFWLITEIPPGLYPDEAMNGNNALEAVASGNFKIFYPENNGREGLFINIQALSIWLFGNEPWALRVVSAIFGTLTILGVFLLAKELSTSRISKSEFLISKQSQNPKDQKEFRDLRFKIRDYRSDIIALLSAFFVATSYWHINFSRIGFRAIAVPFFASFGIYFLLKGLRRGKILDIVWAGIFIGLGFHTYIAFRFMPFVLAVPILWYLLKWWEENKSSKGENQNYNLKLKTGCAPCAIMLFLFVIFVIALPIGYYFLQNPQDFLGRGGQVSIFSAEFPAWEFAKSNVLTLGMFFTRGDCNPRHNYNCQPELHPIVALFFLIGFITAIISIIQNLKLKIQNYNSKLKNSHDASRDTEILHFAFCILISWIMFMSFPATLTREGMPHALRSIGMITPVMVLSGLGAFTLFNLIINWLTRQKLRWLQYDNQLDRIKKEAILLFFLILAVIPFATYRSYFIKWAYAEETHHAFSGDIYNMGGYLKTLPQETKKIILVNFSGVEVRGIPMPAQTVMFLTDTFTEKNRAKNNFSYINNLSSIQKIEGKTVIIPLDPRNKKSINEIRAAFPELKIKVPGDFIALEN